jgi:hypothetical protein
MGHFECELIETLWLSVRAELERGQAGGCHREMADSDRLVPLQIRPPWF